MTGWPRSIRALKTTLKAEIDADVWATQQRRVTAVPEAEERTDCCEVINDLGDEVMKVFRVE